MFAVNIENLKNLKYHTFSKKILVLFQCGIKNEKIFKKQEYIEILKVLQFIINIEEYQNKYD